MSSVLKNLIADTRGTTAIEYGLICGIIVIGALSALSGVADENTGLWATVSSKSGEAIQNSVN